jgi:2-dehydro-3-deoxygluconokinase
MTSHRAHDEAAPDVSSGPAGEAEVVTLGETMALFWPAGGGSLEVATYYERSCGGAESNFCIALARLRHRTRWISRLGDDAFGRYIRTTLEREGVQVTAPADAGAPTAVFFKERVAAGRRRVLYYRRGSAASRLAPDDLRPDHFIGARVLHVTGITPALSASCAAAVEQALVLARAAGALVSVDPNVRPQLWPTQQACRETLHALVARADLVLLGHEDAELLYPGLSEDAVIGAVRAGGAATVVLKLGERGAVAVQEGAWARVEAHPVTVVDTVGAGDGFDAGFVAGWLRGFPLPRCLALAARIGAAAVAVVGDWEGYPTAQEVGL